MANSNDGKIGCAASNRTKIIDPNSFGGYPSSMNHSVQTEDLSISVKLSTSRRGRTILTKDGDSTTSQTTNNISVNFIEGSNINGKKVLSTKYTDLTTIFEQGTLNTETLGISNIDIDFSSAMAPQITIDFIDVRGSSIFQNESDITDSTVNNPYAVFFQLPYPLFELEIKGYYGQPVTYCLHMIKFTSKFNSQTGNFEIKCNFIGYTYAMLSDMLVGFLRVIPFTTIGKTQFDIYNQDRPTPILDLPTLKVKVSEIEQAIQKLGLSSDNSKIINSFNTGKEIIGSIESEYINFSNSVKIKKDNTLDSFIDKFIITENTDLSDAGKTNYTNLDTNVRAAIKKYNELNINGLKLTDSDFLPIKYTPDLTKAKLKPNSTEYIASSFSGADLDKYKSDLLSFVETDGTIATDDKTFRAYDLRKIINIIDEQINLLDTNLTDSNKALANEIKDKVTAGLGFDPTVRNIIEIFTGLIEVFIQTIFEVSNAAERNQKRAEQLKKVFPDDTNNDYTATDIEAFKNNKIFYPWPDYTERDAKTNQYTEKYLGASSLIEDKTAIDEISFIEDLLKAFLTAYEKEQQADALAAKDVTNWFPTNPLDTRLFQTDGKFPYSRTELIDLNSIQRLMLIRGMTFLGYTNDELYLTQLEIQTMAKIEANAIVESVHATLKNTVKNITLAEIVKTTGTFNGFDRPIVNTYNDTYVYNFIFKSNNPTNSDLKVLPVNGDFNNKNIGEFNTITKETIKIDNGILDDDDIKTLLKELSETDNFLTNYSSAKITNNTNKKSIDGGIYIRFLTLAEFENINNAGTLVDTTIKTDSILSLENLKSENILNAGFNCFGGNYGIQEFKNMDYGSNESLKGLPLMYSFYTNFDRNGLAYTRNKSALEQKLKFVTSSIYDFNPTKTNITNVIDTSSIYLNKRDLYDGYGENVKIHTSVGQNRELFNLLTTNSSDISYPYIEQNFVLQATYLTNDLGDSYATIAEYSFSLFGSKWYYLQDLAQCKFDNGKSPISAEKYTKALLFLNTLPFNNDYGEDNTFKNNPFGKPEIKHLFDVRGGFIHAPRLWSVYIGGLLWWLSKDNPITDNSGNIIGGGRGTEDPVKWYKSCTGDHAPNSRELFVSPSEKQYFPKFLNVKGAVEQIKYSEIEDTDIILNLPNQVKEEFKKMYFDFVNGTSEYKSFDFIREKLEINKNANSSQFCQRVTKISKIDGGDVKNVNDKYYVNNSQIIDYFDNLEQYKMITPIIYDGILGLTRHLDALFLELKDGSEAVNNLITALNEEVIIANTGYHIWRGPKTSNFGTSGSDILLNRSSISVSKKTFDDYFNTLTEELKNIAAGYTQSAQTEKALNETFGGTNLNDIKLMLYRNCKNIYDKWLGGISDPNNIIFQCGNDNSSTSNRATTDLALAQKQGRTKARLIDSFRFVNRSFRDIGDELFINPLPLVQKLSDFPNTSTYDVISGLLNDNKFDFVALPTFINFYDDKVLETMFKPISMYEEPIKTCGPSFVCVYVGQKSKNLDLKGSGSNYSNDGFDLRCQNNSLDPSVPDDFKNSLAKPNINGEELTVPYEDPIPVFVVKYSQQNQNLFKDISLDQSEFSESEESIKIMQDISTKGSSTNPTLGGQNMYNVYSVRSYSAEIEMMGNAMIQPMMYFQLDNIPMFHGAYMITRVKHNIQPNHMSTNFTGVRIRNVETPIIDITDIYMDLIDSLGIGGAGNASTGSISTSGMILGKNCGEFKLKNPLVDGAQGFYASKPIRDLVAIVESRGDYNAYNNGVAGSKGTGNYTPSTMTIAEIKAAQRKTGSDRIFAVGKYQLIPDTFTAMVENLKFSGSTVFNADTQEKAGEWLILKGAGYRSGLRAYFAKGSLGTEKNLQEAITDLALEFASFPSYFGVNSRQAAARTNPIGYNSKTAIYGGSAGNAAESKFCAQDVAKALIETWKNYNEGKKPQFDYDNVVARSSQSSSNADNSIALTSSDKSVAIIMGDSTVGVFNSVPNGLVKNKIDISFNKVGETVKWLADKMTEFAKDNKKYGNTKYVFVSIGTNDGYVLNSNSKKKINELNDLIKKVYPNAKRIIIPGTYGWGNVKDKTKQDQDNYYKTFTDLGFIYQYPDSDALAKNSSEAHNPKTDWFIKSTKKIVDTKIA